MLRWLGALALAMSSINASTSQAGEPPQSGGTLIFGRGGDSTSLDPAVVTDGESLNVTDNIFDNLVTHKIGTTQIVPGLARSWTISKDGLSYTFELREGVQFHDGTSVDAAAIKFSFMRQKDKNHPAYGFAGPYVYFTSLGLDKIITSIHVDAPHRVTFKLSRKEAPFLATLAMQSLAIVSPTAVMKHKADFGRHPVGSGPFQFKSWSKNQKIVLTANKNYWEKPPYLKSVIFRSIPDNGTRLLELMAGRIHIMDNPNPDDLEVVRKRLKDRVTINTKPGFNIGYLALNMDKKPFDNKLVRLAIAHAINKQGIVDAVYDGQAQPAVNPLPPSLWGYNNDISDHTYNPQRAKELMKEAGLAKGFDTTLWAMPVPRPYMPDGRKVAEVIQADLAKIGIRAKIVSYEWGTYLDKAQQGEHDMGLFGWTGDIGDPDNFLYVLLDKDSAKKPAQNYSFYRSEELHQILMKAKTTFDQEARATLYRQAQKIIHGDVPMVPLVHSITSVPTVTKVANFVPGPTGRRRFGKVWLR